MQVIRQNEEKENSHAQGVLILQGRVRLQTRICQQLFCDFSNPKTMDYKDQNQVPLFKSWGCWYFLVVVVLVVLILLFYLITKRYS